MFLVSNRRRDIQGHTFLELLFLSTHLFLLEKVLPEVQRPQSMFFLPAMLAEMTSKNATLVLEIKRLRAGGPGSNNVVRIKG